MYDVALSVAACIRADTDVHVAWLASDDRVDGTQAVALTPGGGHIGSFLKGALDDAIKEAANRVGASGGIVPMELGPAEALISGLAQGTPLEIAIVPGKAIPSDIWDDLMERRPVAFAIGLEDRRFTDVTRLDPADEATTDDSRVVCRYQPVPRVVIVGDGPIAEALATGFELVGWQTGFADPATAEGAIATLSAMDGVVVMGHDVESAGRALQAAVRSNAGYIGSIGSESMQGLRRDWLAYRGIEWDRRIHGPAGLPIGADTPGEIAISIVAEAVAASRLEHL